VTTRNPHCYEQLTQVKAEASLERAGDQEEHRESQAHLEKSLEACKADLVLAKQQVERQNRQLATNGAQQQQAMSAVMKELASIMCELDALRVAACSADDDSSSTSVVFDPLDASKEGAEVGSKTSSSRLDDGGNDKVEEKLSNLPVTALREQYIEG
jgi:seryl-tRNA synthetase